MYGSCCTLTHQQQQQQQLGVCRTHEPLLMDEKLFCSLATRSASNHHQHNTAKPDSKPPRKPSITSFQMSHPTIGPVNEKRCSSNSSSVSDKLVNKTNRTGALSIFAIGRQNSKNKEKALKQDPANTPTLRPSTPMLEGASQTVNHHDHQQLSNSKPDDAPNPCITTADKKVSLTPSKEEVATQVSQNTAQQSVGGRTPAGERAHSVPVEAPSITVVRTSSSATITSPSSTVDPQPGQTNNSTVHSTTPTLTNIQRQSATNGSDKKDNSAELVSEKNKPGGPAAGGGIGNSTGKELSATAGGNTSVPRRVNRAGSATSTLTDPRSRTCCFCWCCCFSCSCMRVRANLNDSHRLSSSNDPQSRGDNFSADDVLTPEEAQRWGESFDLLMQSSSGRKVFREFLRSEYSDENIMFWLACEELKTETNPEIVEEKARLIYEDYISILSTREVSLDSRVREQINANMIEPTPRTFDEAQLQIYTLMHRDSYLRFLNSKMYKELLLQSPSQSYSDESSLE